MYKTPRTVIESFLDVSNTQTVKTGRQGVNPRLVRTPEVPSSNRQKMIKRRVSRTPEPYVTYSASKSVPQHDRVSSLRGKRRSFSSSLEVVETPRQLLENFLAGEDTTEPLKRYGSRIPERVTASQPAVPISGRRSSSYHNKTADWLMDFDSDTPRTMLQKYVLNTKDVVETPGHRQPPRVEDMSPATPVIQEAFNTPSPFKSSSVDSADRVSVTSNLSRRKTPRVNRSRFTVSMREHELPLADESVIPPTNPAEYQIPSPFQSSSSDEESFIPETQSTFPDNQSSVRTYRTFRRIGPGDNIHDIGDISGNFSPKIVSTQKNIAMETEEGLDFNSSGSDIPSVSPTFDRQASRIHTTPRNLGNESHCYHGDDPQFESQMTLPRSNNARTPESQKNTPVMLSPQGSVRSLRSRSSDKSRPEDVSRMVEERRLASGPSENIYTLGNISEDFSPKIASTQKHVAMEMEDDGQYDSTEAVTPSPNVSPNVSQGNSVTPSNLSRESRSHGGSFQITPGRSSQNSRPIESPSSLALVKSSTTRTPLQPLHNQTLASPTGSVRSAGSRSSNRSRTQNVSMASPIVAGRHRMSEMTATLPHNTINFSPQVASTQNFSTMPRIGTSPGRSLNLSRNEKSGRVDSGEESRQSRTTDHDDVEQVDGEWQDVQEHMGETSNATGLHKTTSAQKPKKTVVCKPRAKSKYSMPANVVKKHFTHFAGMRVSKEAIEIVMEVSEKYWDILARDLEAYAKHAGRKQINMADFALLFKRQGYVTEKQSLKSLIERYLPMEEREKLIPVARAGNRIEPKL